MNRFLFAQVDSVVELLHLVVSTVLLSTGFSRKVCQGSRLNLRVQQSQMRETRQSGTWAASAIEPPGRAASDPSSSPQRLLSWPLAPSGRCQHLADACDK
jgi:hypothetical protein